MAGPHLLDQERVSRVCGLNTGENGGHVQGVCRARSIADAANLTVEGDAMVVNDWMFAAPSPTADTFARLYTDFGAYQAALRELGLPRDWLHFLWSAHAHALGAAAGVRPAFEVGLDFAIFRFAIKGRTCSGNASAAAGDASNHVHLPVAGPASASLPEALCPAPRRGSIECKHSSLWCSATGG